MSTVGGRAILNATHEKTFAGMARESSTCSSSSGPCVCLCEQAGECTINGAISGILSCTPNDYNPNGVVPTLTSSSYDMCYVS